MSCACLHLNTGLIKVVDIKTDDAVIKFAPAGHMAEAIISILAERGDCIPEDLSAKGFTRDEVKEHWHMAYSLASVEIKYMGNKKLKPLFWWRKK